MRLLPIGVMPSGGGVSAGSAAAKAVMVARIVMVSVGQGSFGSAWRGSVLIPSSVCRVVGLSQLASARRPRKEPTVSRCIGGGLKGSRRIMLRAAGCGGGGGALARLGGAGRLSAWSQQSGSGRTSRPASRANTRYSNRNDTSAQHPTTAHSGAQQPRPRTQPHAHALVNTHNGVSEPHNAARRPVLHNPHHYRMTQTSPPVPARRCRGAQQPSRAVQISSLGHWCAQSAETSA